MISIYPKNWHKLGFEVEVLRLTANYHAKHYDVPVVTKLSRTSNFTGSWKHEALLF